MRPELHLRTIILRGRIDKKMKEDVDDALKHFIGQGCPKITIFIDSLGGDHYYSMKICEALFNYPGDTVGYVQIKAYSGAVTILQGCNKRKMASEASLMIHEPTPTNPSNSDLIIELEACLQELCNLFSHRSGNYSPQFFINQCRKGAIITSKEALIMGLIDEIIF